MKLKYSRSRSCALNDSEYRRAFEAFCWFSKGASKSVFKLEEITTLARRALSECGFKSDPEKYIRDIVSITCLLLKDGNDYRFIHKSVQEYYCASFLRRSSDIVIERFFKKAIEFSSFNNPWKSELFFLGEIDEYRYSKYYILVAAKSLFNLQERDMHTITQEDITSVALPKFKATLIYPEIRDSTHVESWGITPSNYGPFDELFINRMYHRKVGPLWANIDMGKLMSLAAQDSISTAKSKVRLSITMENLYSCAKNSANIEDDIKPWAVEVLKHIQNAQITVDKYDDVNRFEDILGITNAFPRDD